MEMNEKGTEPYKTEILSREGLLAAGCPKEAIHKILQEKNGRCQCRCHPAVPEGNPEKLYREQEKLTNVDYLLYHLEKKQ